MIVSPPISHDFSKLKKFTKEALKILDKLHKLEVRYNKEVETLGLPKKEAQEYFLKNIQELDPETYKKVLIDGRNFKGEKLL